MFDKEDRYGLALRIATALHDHRVGVTPGHYENDEWWCCVQGILPVVEEIVRERTAQPIVEPTEKWCQLTPSGIRVHGFLFDDEDELPLPPEIVEQRVVEHEGC